MGLQDPLWAWRGKRKKTGGTVFSRMPKSSQREQRREVPSKDY
jgi:hypothetical protein